MAYDGQTEVDAKEIKIPDLLIIIRYQHNLPRTNSLKVIHDEHSGFHEIDLTCSFVGRVFENHCA